tara:strand:- start:13189 stop:15474 length:2286 start_codon:yes stop_codon:yes gene_type:complete
MRKYLILIIILFPMYVFTQSNHNLTLIGDFDWNGLNYDSEGSDIWGWKNTSTGIEYALVGLNSGFSVVDLSSPQNPFEAFFIPGVNTTWRDIKTWENYAYVINEGGDGLLIVDLNDLTGQTYVNFTDYFNTAHNIYMDENGVAYIFGTDVGNGGAIFLDVTANPMNPTYLGTWDDYYIHDGMVRGDTMWVGCIYEGEFYSVDVSNKSNPQILGHHPTPNQFTHNAWISDDGDFLFTTDEQSDSYIGSYDVSNMNNIQEVDRIQSNPGSNSIPHNTHVDGNFLVTSWYRDGTTVHDATFPNNLIQVAYYDSYSGSGDGFDGCWGTYPFLPSGLIISSDINSANNGNGKLLIYERGFTQAAFIEGNVTDITNSSPLSGVSIEILNTVIPNSSNTNLVGNYFSGTADPNLYDIVFTLNGYESDTIAANLVSGVVTVVDAQLVPLNPVSINGMVIDINGNPIPNSNVLIQNNSTNLSFNTDNQGNFNINSIFPGNYSISAGQWGYITTCMNSYIDGSPIVCTLQNGFYDDFTFDFGWLISGGLNSGDPGVWEIGKPEGTNYNGLDFNPDNDVDNDCFENAYVTGVNSGSSVGSNDVDDFNTILTSPVFNCSNGSEISYSVWFSNGGGGWGGGPSPNDELSISVTNGSSTVLLEKMDYYSSDMGQWNDRTYDLSQYIDIQSSGNWNNMQLIIETADWDSLGGHLVEAAFDNFRVINTVSNVVHPTNNERKLLMITDILGRETKNINSGVIIYIYSDGYTEKRMFFK